VIGSNDKVSNAKIYNRGAGDREPRRNVKIPSRNCGVSGVFWLTTVRIRRNSILVDRELLSAAGTSVTVIRHYARTMTRSIGEHTPTVKYYDGMIASQRDRAIWEYRRRGYKLREIAAHLGMSTSGVSDAVRRIAAGRPGRDPRE
jgi:hypothetical protein